MIVLKFLLSQENIDINKLTHKGTALHVACSMNKPIYVSMLLAHNADPSIMNNEGYIPADLSPNEELINIINKESKLKEEFSFKEVFFIIINIIMLNVRWILMSIHYIQGLFIK